MILGIMLAYMLLITFAVSAFIISGKQEEELAHESHSLSCLCVRTGRPYGS